MSDLLQQIADIEDRIDEATMDDSISMEQFDELQAEWSRLHDAYTNRKPATPATARRVNPAARNLQADRDQLAATADDPGASERERAYARAQVEGLDQKIVQAERMARFSGVDDDALAMADDEAQIALNQARAEVARLALDGLDKKTPEGRRAQRAFDEATVKALDLGHVLQARTETAAFTRYVAQRIETETARRVAEAQDAGIMLAHKAAQDSGRPQWEKEKLLEEAKADPTPEQVARVRAEVEADPNYSQVLMS